MANSDASCVHARTLGRLAADEIRQAGNSLSLELDGGVVALTNLDRQLWPATTQAPAVTKRDFLAYLAGVSPWLLPHVHDRVVTLAGYRDARSSALYFQRHRDRVPEFVETVRVYAESYERDRTNVLCNNLATLLWLGQINNLALHVSLFRVSDGGSPAPGAFTGSKQAVEGSILNRPDFLLFDIDPYVHAGSGGQPEPAPVHREDWEGARETALALKQLLDGVGLRSFVKTSGATGGHVLVPVLRDLTFEATSAICSNFAAALQRRDGRVTTMWTVSDRRGKVFVDCRQNGYSKSIAAPYSPRAQPSATVSTPLRWEELDSADPTHFTIRSTLARLEQDGDPWEDLLASAVDLSAVISGAPGP